MLATIAVLALTPGAASAAEIEVDTGADGASDCTLRAAIAAANTDSAAQSCDAGSGTDTITFDPTVFPPNGGTTIFLGAQLAVTSSMAIQGPGSAALQLSGGSAVRIFVVDGAAAQNVEISGMTMSLGSIQGGSPQQGGAVFNGADSTLSLQNVVIQQSSIQINQSSPGSATLVGEGGGVYSAGDLSVAGSTIFLNLINVINTATGVTSVTANGGGIAMGPGASLSVTESDVRRNSALTVDTMGPHSQSSGGGIYAGDAMITQSSVTGNQSVASSDAGFSSAGGGGITVGGTASRIELDTIGDNTVVSTGSGSADGSGNGEGSGTAQAGAPLTQARYRETPQPRYPDSARRDGKEGRVLLRVLIDEEGRTKVIEVNTSSGHEMLDQAAIAALKKWRFVPARASGKPVETWVKVPIEFQLSNSQR